MPAGFKRNSTAIMLAIMNESIQTALLQGLGAIPVPKNHYSSYALALEKLSKVLYGGCSCQFLPCLVIIKEGNYPDRR